MNKEYHKQLFSKIKADNVIPDVDKISMDKLSDYNWPSEFMVETDKLGSFDVLRRFSMFELRGIDEKLHSTMFVETINENVYAVGCFIPRPGSTTSFSQTPYLWAKFKVEYYSLDFGQLSKSNDPNRGLWFSSKSIWYKPELPSPRYCNTADRDMRIVDQCLLIRETILSKYAHVEDDKHVCNVRIEDMEEFVQDEMLSFIITNNSVLMNILTDIDDNDNLKMSIMTLKRKHSRGSLPSALKPSSSSSSSSSSLKSKILARERMVESDPILNFDDNDTKARVKSKHSQSFSSFSLSSGATPSCLLPKSESGSERKRLLSPLSKGSTITSSSAAEAKPPSTSTSSSTSASAPTEQRIKKKKLVDDEDEDFLAPVPHGNKEKTKVIALGRDVIGSKTPKDNQRDKTRYISASKPQSTFTSTKFLPGARPALPTSYPNLHRATSFNGNSSTNSIPITSLARSNSNSSTSSIDNTGSNQSGGRMPLSIDTLWESSIAATSPVLSESLQLMDDWTFGGQSPTPYVYENPSFDEFMMDEVRTCLSEETKANTEENKRMTSRNIGRSYDEANKYFMKIYTNNEYWIHMNQHQQVKVFFSTDPVKVCHFVFDDPIHNIQMAS